MQYGLNVDTYKRVKSNRKVLNLGEEPIRYINILLGGILVSRVIFYLDAKNISGIAPFGIAYLLAIIIKNSEKSTLSAAIGAAIGYISVFSSVNDRYANLIVIILLVLYSAILKLMDKPIKEYYIYGLIVMGYVINGFVISGYDLGVNITISLINTLVILPMYYIIKYGITCIEEFNTNYFFSVEEMISMGLIICLIISGIGQLSILGISIRNVCAYATVLLISYVGGATYGTAMGVSMGMIIGLSSGDIVNAITYYSVAGLISGVFKDIGKFFTFLSYLIMYFALSLYCHNLAMNSLVEVLIAGGIFFVIPKFVIDAMGFEINIDKKRGMVNEVELTEIKEEFTSKIKLLENSLVTVSRTLYGIGENDKLMYKNKSTALIESLADRVCLKCSRCDKCWEREFNITYNSFEKLIKSYENKKITFPSELEKVCLLKFELIKGTQRIVDNLNSKEILKDNLGESRQLLANQVKNIASSIGDMLADFKEHVSVCNELERVTRRALNKNGIHYIKLFCYRDVNGRLKMKLRMKNCGGANFCGKRILPIINDVVSEQMCIGGEGCKINPINNECIVIFEESPKYDMISFGAIACKEGEEHTGDTFSFCKTNEGTYMTLISDGMGSGPEAGKESKATVELVENFIESGFEKNTAINMVNSIMAMKFEEDEKFSTLDLNLVDLYSGVVSFIKVGAVASFIKSGESIKPITSNMPPFGLVDKIELEEVKHKVKSGDLIITISDGVLDIDRENLGKYNWLVNYLENSSRDPKQLAGDILDKAKELSGGIAKDDMTVVVSKVYSAC
ncbi:stage II sporulation protein E [Clostridium sp. SHJSY1]|uniref:stage II sporulation protein E n=1 Tax=Clostridium sp. SHJSY1 TaxID=2942483 RepID=UPI0028748689|nr:stage II sporulation protein E [Clostridium sp. SHJSY1]MDS0525295.1 stage II sporulation protein E [Clostridium sp. SHJSY1]